jgi:hypothetical protein
LNNRGQFEKLLHEAGEPKAFANGYTSIGLKAGSMLVYNDRVARFISATTNTTFLDNDSIASRYGIKRWITLHVQPTTKMLGQIQL